MYSYRENCPDAIFCIEEMKEVLVIACLGGMLLAAPRVECSRLFILHNKLSNTIATGNKSSYNHKMPTLLTQLAFQLHKKYMGLQLSCIAFC